MSTSSLATPSVRVTGMAAAPAPSLAAIHAGPAARASLSVSRPARARPAGPRALAPGAASRAPGAASRAPTVASQRGPVGFSGPGVSELAGGVSAFASALGFYSTSKGVLDFFGSGLFGGGGAGELAKALAEFLFFPDRHAFAFSCVPCVKACEMGMRQITIAPDPEVLGALGEHVVRLVDRVLRATHKTSLVQFLHTSLVSYVNTHQLSRQRGPAGYLRLRWLLPLSSRAVGPKRLRALRLAVLRYVMAQYVEWYVPQLRGAYDLELLERKLSTTYRAQTNAFLRNRDEDLAPVVGFLVRHLVQHNRARIGASAPTLACLLCETKALNCVEKTAVAAAAALVVSLPRALRARRAAAARARPPAAAARRRVRVARGASRALALAA